MQGRVPRGSGTVPDDTRGLIDPATMMRHVDFARSDPGPSLDGIVEWFWSVAWDLPEGQNHDQRVLNHPAGNVSVGTIDDRGVPLDPAEGRIYGVQTGLATRHLSGHGWTVAARSTVGGLGALLGRPAREAAGAEWGLDEAIPGIDGKALVAEIDACDSNPERTELLRHALEDAIAERDPDLIAEARRVAAIARTAEAERDVTKVEQLADRAGISTRTLQRLFDTHVGISPSFVIRRWRIIDAVEATRRASAGRGDWPGWSAVAAELGYSDQAHLTRDFRRLLGLTPSAYLAQSRGA